MSKGVPSPHMVVRKMMSLAVHNTMGNNLLQKALSQPDCEFAPERLRACFPDTATAWAQMVLMDAYRLQKLWARSIPFRASLQVTDLMWRAFGPPPPPSQILKASGLSRQRFVVATAQGTASALALNLAAPECEQILLIAVGKEAVCINSHQILQVIGRLYRSLEVTARRLQGYAVRDVSQAANWPAAIDSDALPLPLLRYLLDLTNATPNAAGLAMLLRSASGTGVLDFGRLGVGFEQLIDNDEVSLPLLNDSWGVHNCTTDVLVLWGNVVRRSPATLEKWAKYECDCDVHFHQEPPGHLVQGPQKPLSVKEYDPETKRYFTHCDTTSGLNPTRYAWLAADRIPTVLRIDFMQRRIAHRASTCGRILGTLLAASGEYGVQFVCRLADVLHNHLRIIVPGDPGLNDVHTLTFASQFLTRPGYHLSWRSICNVPWFTKVAMNAAHPSKDAPQSILTTMRLAHRALVSKSAAAALMTFAENRLPTKSALHLASVRLAAGTNPALNTYTRFTAAVAAFVVPDVRVTNLLIQTLLNTADVRAMACVQTASAELDSRLPPELKLLVFRHWIRLVATSL